MKMHQQDQDFLFDLISSKGFSGILVLSHQYANYFDPSASGQATLDLVYDLKNQALEFRDLNFIEATKFLNTEEMEMVNNQIQTYGIAEVLHQCKKIMHFLAYSFQATNLVATAINKIDSLVKA